MKCDLISGGVYEILNTKNGKRYVGSTVNFKYRCALHQRQLEKGKHHSPILQNSWNKYGKDSFVFKVLEKIEDLTKLIPREQNWINKLKPEFNWGPTAGSPLGVKRSEVYKKNMRKIALARIKKQGKPFTNVEDRIANAQHLSVIYKGKALRERGHKEKCKCTVCRQRRGERVGIKSQRYIQRVTRRCECGCQVAFICLKNSKKRFVSGHNNRGKPNPKAQETIDKQRVSLKRYYRRLKRVHA